MYSNGQILLQMYLQKILYPSIFPPMQQILQRNESDLVVSTTDRFIGTLQFHSKKMDVQNILCQHPHIHVEVFNLNKGS